MANFTYHAARNPCPICGGVEDCRTSITGIIHCWRGERHSPPAGFTYIRDDSQAFAMFAPDDDNREAADKFQRRAANAENERKRRKKAGERSTTTTAFNRIAADKRPMTDSERDTLASLICLPMGIFSLTDVEFLPFDSNNRPAFVFPERSATSAIVGFTLRYTDGTKRNHGGRGLTLPTTPTPAMAADDANGTVDTSMIFAPEGASDTLAMLAMNLHAVGRPSNTGGVDYLIELWRSVPLTRKLVIVAENDAKPDGRWPGRDGAERTAKRIADALSRTVYIVFPPPGAKDVRAMVQAEAVNIRRGDKTLTDLGREFLRHATATMTATSTVTDTFTIAITPTLTPSPLSPLHGYRAVDSQPPPDTNPVPERPRCEFRRSVLLRNDNKCSSRLSWFDCQRLDCPCCGPKKKLQYIATVTEHLRDHAEKVSPTVHTFWVDASDWPVVSAKLRESKSDYFRLDTGFGRLMVIASDKPATTAMSAYAELPCAEAGHRMSAAIRQLPEVREKMLTTSRGWKLLGTAKSPEWAGWRRITAIVAPQRSLYEVLEHHKIAYRPISHAGVYFGWQAWEWHDGASDSDWQKVYDDLTLGEVMPNIDIAASFRTPAATTAEDDEWATMMPAPATGPPRSGEMEWF